MPFFQFDLTGQMTGKKLLKNLPNHHTDENLAMQDLESMLQKLGLTKEEFIEMMNGENKTFRDYASNASLINMAVKIARLVGFERRQFR